VTRVPPVARVVALLIGVAWLPVRADVDKAHADFKAGRYLDAAAEMQAVVDRSPGYDYGYFFIGHCMLKMGHAPEAEVQFRRAIDIKPSRSEYYQGLAMALKAEADWARTIQATTEGLARGQDTPSRYALLKLRGYAYGALQRWERAVQDLEAARRIKQEPSVLLMLGKAYFSNGDFAAAVPPLLAGLSYAPEDATVLRLLAESYLRVAASDHNPTRKRLEYVESLGYAQRLTSIVPSDLDAIALIGRAALGAGRLAQAESVFLHVLQHDPRKCYAMVNLGRTYFAAERWTEAEAFLRKAAACAPRMAEVYETLGELYLKRGLTQAAADAFRRAEEIDPTDRNPRAFGAERHNPPGSIPVSGPR
jgi:tetratricopeptide (TPR) repeat protein